MNRKGNFQLFEKTDNKKNRVGTLESNTSKLTLIKPIYTSAFCVGGGREHTCDTLTSDKIEK